MRPKLAHAVRKLFLPGDSSYMRATVILFCLLALALPIFGQSNYCHGHGTVRDAQSLPVAKAIVRFKALSTGAVRVGYDQPILDCSPRRRFRQTTIS